MSGFFRRKSKAVAALVLSFVLASCLLCGCGGSDGSDLMANYAASDSVVNDDIGSMRAATFTPLLSQWFICDVSEDMLTTDYAFDEANPSRSGAAFVIDRTENKLLFGYHMFDKVAPASVTKLMTALVVLQRCDVNDVVTIDATVAKLARGSVAELKEGDEITVYNLLIALLTVSANNAAVALARHVAGTEEDFVKLMNQEMDKLGANDTTFVNSSGLQVANHMVTAYDMYIVYQECTKYPAFREIMKLNSGEYEYTNAAGEQCVRAYKTTNCFKLGTYPYPSGIEILGSKTGTTDRAGYCLLLHVRGVSGHEYLLGAFHCETETKLYQKMNTLMETYCK